MSPGPNGVGCVYVKIVCKVIEIRATLSKVRCPSLNMSSDDRPRRPHNRRELRLVGLREPHSRQIGRQLT